MSDKERIKELEKCLSGDQVESLKKIKRGLLTAVIALGGCSALEAAGLALLLYKIFG